MVKRLVMLGQVAPGASGAQVRSRRPGLAVGRAGCLWRPGTGGVNLDSIPGGEGSPTPPDDEVIGSAQHMAAQGWNIVWVTAGAVYRIQRQGDMEEYIVDRPYLDSCNYSNMPGPMEHDLMAYSVSKGICEVAA